MTDDSASQRYSVNADEAYWRILDGEAVIISAETSHYYSLNASGTFIWELLVAGGLTAEEIATRVADRYMRPVDEALVDVQQVLGQLEAEKLITSG
jgi:hypothetical protein